MKQYHIRRTGRGVQVEVREEVEITHFHTLFPGSSAPETEQKYRTVVYPLVDLNDAGFEYGYLGGGPGNLALAILANYLGESNATKDELYRGVLLSGALRMGFKEDFIATMNKEKDHHLLSEDAIRGWMRMVHPRINEAEYKEQRDQYRLNLYRYNRLTDILENTSNPSLQKEWDVLLEETSAYESWIQEIGSG